jgi:hypothetical protein
VNRWLLLPVAVLAVAMIATFAGDRLDNGPPSVGSAEHALIIHYIQPLRDAGMNVEVESTCHYRVRSDSEPWQLESHITVDADRADVADVLEGSVAVIKRDRSDWLMQQLAGDPLGGWNGALMDLGGRTSIGVVRNNVAPSPNANLGWQQVCPYPSE